MELCWCGQGFGVGLSLWGQETSLGMWEQGVFAVDNWPPCSPARALGTPSLTVN